METLDPEPQQATQMQNDQASSMQNNKSSRAKRPVSARKLEANRRNALRSTGPKTLCGKRNSRRNAFQHGLSAGTVIEEVVSINESRQDYEDLRRRLRQHYEPVGPAEELEVDRIARCWWKLQRASRYEDAEIRSATLKTAGAEQADAQNTMPAEDQALIRYMCDVRQGIKDRGEVPSDLKNRILAEPLLRHVWPELERQAEALVNLASERDAKRTANKIEEHKRTLETCQLCPTLSGANL